MKENNLQEKSNGGTQTANSMNGGHGGINGNIVREDTSTTPNDGENAGNYSSRDMNMGGDMDHDDCSKK